MLPSTGVRTLTSNANVLHPNNNLFREKMSTAKSELILTQMSKPWAIVKRLVGLVIITYLLSQSILMVGIGLFWGGVDGILMSYIGLFCSLPLLFIFFWIRRPRLIHVQLAIPDENGKKMHILPDNSTLITPIPTTYKHHLVKDSGLLDVPPSKNLWIIFSLVLTFSVMIFMGLLSNPSDLMILTTMLFAIPAWLAGFSIPVFAWWSYSARTLNMPTTRHRAESALVAGMICTIPALLINTGAGLIFDEFGYSYDSAITQIFILAVVAPIGEEICKLGAVFWCKDFIDSPRRGFEIGFTVGLGFAMLENLQYIALSWTGGPLSFTLTSLIRAIGSIPGHALWTGLTGVGFAWFILKNKKQKDSNILSSPSNENLWQLVDSKTNEIIETTIETERNSEEISENILIIRKEDHEVFQNNENKLPKSIAAGLFLAILGHSFWNGSSFFVDYLFSNLGVDLIISTIASLLWIIMLITGLLLIGRFILQNVRLLPDNMV